MEAGSRVYSTLLVAGWVLCCGVCWQQEGNSEPARRRLYEEYEEALWWSEYDPDLQDNDLSMVNNTRRIILPGTKWCGQGNIAKDFTDLGHFKDTDACCREHDRCDDVIGSGYLNHDLHNDREWTRLHCDCDIRFWLCLHRTGLYAYIIKFGYFDLLTTTCFRKDYPITGCKKNGPWFLKHKCAEYSYDTSGEQRYQWFDSMPPAQLLDENSRRSMQDSCPGCSRRTHTDTHVSNLIQHD